MITAEFLTHSGSFWGVLVSGHAEYDESGKDIVCAAVSAATIMALNTVTEVLRAKAQVKSSDALLSLHLSESNQESEHLLEGLFLFLSDLTLQYPEYLAVSIQERSFKS